MPFIALDIKGKRKCSLELSESEYRQAWRCPSCDSVFSFIDCETRKKHFRHLERNGPCEWEPESDEHLELKYFVKTRLEQLGIPSDYEYRSESRIADVVAFLPNRLMAIECQVSPTTKTEVVAKNIDYLIDGIAPIWVFHSKYYLQETDKDYYSCYQLRQVERDFQSKPWLIYYSADTKDLLKFDFKAKWAKGGGDCTTLHFISKKRHVNLGGLAKWLSFLPFPILLQHYVQSSKIIMREAELI